MFGGGGGRCRPIIGANGMFKGAGIVGPIGTGGIAGPRLSDGKPGGIGVELTEHIAGVLIPVARAEGFV